MADEKSLVALRKVIREKKQSGLDSRADEQAYYTRYSLPVACLIFAFVAPLLSIRFAKLGAFIGVILSLFLIGLYYNAFVISDQIVGPNKWANPMVAAWLPNICVLVMGLLAMRRLEQV